MEQSDSQNSLLRRTGTFSAHKKYKDIVSKLQFQIKREKETAQNEQIIYDKVRWPCYKEMIFRRKYQTQLPLNSTQVKRMLGLKQAPRGAGLQR